MEFVDVILGHTVKTVNFGTRMLKTKLPGGGLMPNKRNLAFSGGKSG